MGTAIFIILGAWLDYGKNATLPNLTLLLLGGHSTAFARIRKKKRRRKAEGREKRIYIRIAGNRTGDAKHHRTTDNAVGWTQADTCQHETN